MRHSLFFRNQAQADDAHTLVNEEVTDLEEVYQTEDEETGTIEVRFFTPGKLADWMARYLIQHTRPSTYALNCED
jgi:hypothetical protein